MKISELLELEGMSGFQGNIESGVYFPVVVKNATGNFVNRRVTFDKFWPYLSAKIEREFEDFKATYIFGGTIINPEGGGDDPGSGDTPSGEIPSDINVLLANLRSDINDLNQAVGGKLGSAEAANTYATKDSVNGLNTLIIALNETVENNIPSLNSAVERGFYIRILGNSTTTCYSYSPRAGFNDNANIPSGATNVIELRTFDPEQAMYKLTYRGQVLGNASGNDYIITLGTATLSAPSSSATVYNKGAIDFNIKGKMGTTNIDFGAITPYGGSTSDYVGPYLLSCTLTGLQAADLSAGTASIEITVSIGDFLASFICRDGQGVTFDYEKNIVNASTS